MKLCARKTSGREIKSKWLDSYCPKPGKQMTHWYWFSVRDMLTRKQAIVGRPFEFVCACLEVLWHNHSPWRDVDVYVKCESTFSHPKAWIVFPLVRKAFNSYPCQSLGNGALCWLFFSLGSVCSCPALQEYCNMMKRRSRDMETETEEELLLLVYPSPTLPPGQQGSASPAEHVIEEYVGDAPFAGMWPFFSLSLYCSALLVTWRNNG